MRLRVIAAGKVREPHLRTAVDDYVGRIKRHLPFEEVEVPQGRDAKAEHAISRALPPGFEVWVLDASGREPASEELAGWLEHRMSLGVKGVAFVIGGAEGLPPGIVARADLRLSLSQLTLPHRLVRVVLVEQIYRALTIIRGESYNK